MANYRNYYILMHTFNLCWGMELLKQFNLTDNEIKVYLSLLELGSALVGDITKKTGIHRRNVYDCIERLVKKGLVGYVSNNNRKFFRATEPSHFFSLPLPGNGY